MIVRIVFVVVVVAAVAAAAAFVCWLIGWLAGWLILLSFFFALPCYMKSIVFGFPTNGSGYVELIFDDSKV